MSCVTQSACPPACKGEVERRVGREQDFARQLDTFSSVFVDDGAPCLPPREAAK